jgi:hypothetical protein
MVTHFTYFEKVAVFSGSARLKVRTEENIDTVQRQMQDDSNYLSGNCRSRLSYQCQFVKELFERILKIQ